ncbi:MAG: hypothetical protein JOY71_06255 [Acetobacteraceae bacterium]|nr:hypothetical protein [Acetobacteraceae bacterium]
MRLKRNGLIVLWVAVPITGYAQVSPEPVPTAPGTTAVSPQPVPTAPGTTAVSPQAVPTPTAPPATPTAGQAGSLVVQNQQPSTAVRPRFTVQAGINVSEEFTDNVFQLQSPREADAITLISPNFSVQADSPHITGNLFYTPTLALYASHSNQNFVSNFLNGSAHATVVEDALYFDLRSFAGVGPTYGGFGFGGLGGVSAVPANLTVSNGSPGANGFGSTPRQNLTQYFQFSASPYFVHRFGGDGTLLVGYTISQSNTYNGASRPLFPVAPSVASSNGTLTTNSEYLQFATGENLGRIQDVVVLDANQYSGNGIASGGYENFAINQLSYALTHEVALFGQIGWEDIHYSGIPPTRINDAVWQVGTTLTPNPNSLIRLGYGHQFGFNSFLMNAYYQVTARTSVFGSYATGLGTNLQEITGQVDTSTVTTSGGTINQFTGAPQIIGNAALGIGGNNNLYQIRRLTLGASTAYDRDTFTLLVLQEQRNLVSSTSFASFASGSSGHGVSGQASWTHSLSPVAAAVLTLTYGGGTGAAFSGFSSTGTNRFFGANLYYSYAFSPTLFGNASYWFIDQSSNAVGQGFTQNVVLLGVTKQF